MPEAGGKGALYVDPFDVNNIAKPTLTLLKNKNLKIDLIKKGLMNVKKFSWQKTAKQTIKL